jgi:hypothetical protein
MNSGNMFKMESRGGISDDDDDDDYDDDDGAVYTTDWRKRIINPLVGGVYFTKN